MSNSCEASLSDQLSTMKTLVEKLTLADLVPIGIFGDGASSRVDMVGVRGDENQIFALKIMRKSQCSREREKINSEKNIMAAASKSHFVVKLIKTLQNTECVFLLMEPLLGGELYSILEGSKSFLSDHEAQFYGACVVEGLEYLHSQNIVHGDLKSTNLVFDERGYLKIIDFGFAKTLSLPESKTRFRGTMKYMAPELFLRQGHNTSADYWALGILLFEMLTGGYDLFNVGLSADHVTMGRNLIKHVMAFKYPVKIGEGATLLIKALCSVDPDQRIGYRKGCDEIRQHKWFHEFPWLRLQNRTLEPPIKPQKMTDENNNNNCRMYGVYSGTPCTADNHWSEF